MSTDTIYRIETPSSSSDVELKIGSSATETPQAYIHRLSLENDVNPALADYVVKHESRYCVDRLGDMGIYRKGKPVRARGCFQITEAFHPEVTDDCAFDLACSFTWALPRLKDKTLCLKEWTTCRNYYNNGV